MAECQLPKLDVAGSNPVGRSTSTEGGYGITRSPLGVSTDGYGQVVPPLLSAAVLSPLPQIRNVPTAVLEYL